MYISRDRISGFSLKKIREITRKKNPRHDTKLHLGKHFFHFYKNVDINSNQLTVAERHNTGVKPIYIFIYKEKTLSSCKNASVQMHSNE